MLTIKTEIGNFGDWHSLYMEMINTGTDRVKAECSYCFQHIATITLTLNDVKLLESESLLDDETVDTVQKFVHAVQQLLEKNN